MIRHIATYLLLWMTVPAIVAGQAFKSENGHVEFHSSVPLHSFTGKSDHLVGKISLQDSTVDFYVDVHTLHTGIGMRDDDMLETLNAEKHPFADFYGKLISDFDQNSTKPQEVRVKGKFSVHGISRQISVTGTLQKTDAGLQLKASWTLNMKDYNIKPPSILFYRVSKQVDLSISSSLQKIK